MEGILVHAAMLGHLINVLSANKHQVSVVIVIQSELEVEANESLSPLGISVYTLSEIIIRGRDNPVTLPKVEPNDIYCVCYSAETTGIPKDVIITHAVMTSNILANRDGLETTEVVTHYSFLPFADPFERMMTGGICACGGREMIATGGLITNIAADLRDLKAPTIASVPKIFIRYYTEFRNALNKMPKYKRGIFWGSYYLKRYLKSRHHSVGFLDRIAFAPFQESFGPNGRSLVTVGGALPAKIHEFLEVVFGAEVRKEYGCSEAGTVNIFPSDDVAYQQISVQKPQQPKTLVPLPLPCAVSHFQPEKLSKYSLGIDLGGFKIRFGVYSKDNPKSAFEVNVIENQLSLNFENIVVMGNPIGSIPIPSAISLLGQKFKDPAIIPIISRFPLRIFEHPESHTCVIDVEGQAVTPETMIATIFAYVKESAQRIVGEEVVDASISMPTMFTSTQRESIRDAAESVGIRIAHLASGSLLAAQAMRTLGELNEFGFSMIIDVGLSKTEISLIRNTMGGIREVRNAYSNTVNIETVENTMIEILLMIVRKQVKIVNSALRMKLVASVKAALTCEHHPRVIKVDLGNGNEFEQEITDIDLASACVPMATGIQTLIREAVTEIEESQIKVIRCIGGGTLLKPIANIVQEAFPKAEVRQLDPDKMIVCGATLDGAQQTNRLPAEMHQLVASVAPYSIGLKMCAGVVEQLIQRGESLPVVTEKVVTTCMDNQTNVSLKVFQGEHMLSNLGNSIGKTSVDHIPALPREQAQVSCRIEYTKDGTLKFSAQETTRGKPVKVTFRAKTEFTEEDRVKFEHASNTSKAEEIISAERQYFRTCLSNDIERAENQTHNDRFKSLAQKWKKWLLTHKNEAPEFLEKKWLEAQQEFQAINPSFWGDIDDPRDGIRFRVIWPIAPSVTEEGAAIIRFMSDVWQCQRFV
jgi:molecular chaperone DnaK (HSP70)